MIHFKFFPSDSKAKYIAKAEQGLAKLNKNPDAGFLLERIDDALILEVKNRASEILNSSKQVIVLGIGGSQLGAKAFVELANESDHVQFWDHLEPETFEKRKKKLKSLDLIHWVWISKSGTTIEIMKTLEIVENWYKKVGLKLSDHSTVIAQDSPAPLQIWAKEHQVSRLNVLSRVSGRYSVFTAAGLLPMALVGVDLNEVNLGILAANKMHKQVIDLAAEALASFERNELLLLFWTYADRLRPFSYWFQQLWAESLAKLETRSGEQATKVSFPVPCVGSLDQHSILQQAMDGTTQHWNWFFFVKSLSQQGEIVGGKSLGQIYSAQGQGTAQALQEAKKSLITLNLEQLDVSTLSTLMYFLMLVVGTIGEALDIDPFNQPGVERGKTITQDLLRQTLS